MESYFILLFSILALLIHAGFTLMQIGGGHSRNALHVATRNLTNFLLAICAFFFIGYPLMFFSPSAGRSSWGELWIEGFGRGDALGGGILGDRLYHALLATLGLPIIAGAMTGRVKLGAYLFGNLFFSLLLYPMIGRWIWAGGWLSDWGLVDRTGATVIFTQAGAVAMGASWVLRPRGDGEEPAGAMGRSFAHHFPLMALGLFLLWLGWFGLNLGAFLPSLDFPFSLLAVQTIFAGCGGGAGVLLVSGMARKKIDPQRILGGILAGLVAGSAGAGLFRPASVLAVGTIAGLIAGLAPGILARLRIDDPSGSIAVFGLGGIWGGLAVGFFSEGPMVWGSQGPWIQGVLFGGGMAFLGIQGLGAMLIFLFALLLSALFFRGLKMIRLLSISPEEEQRGLDSIEYDQSAYPLWDEGQRKIDRVLREFQRAQELSFLHEISQSMHTLDLDEILELILKGVAQGIGFDRVRLYLLDEKKDQLICRVAVGMEKDKIENLNLPYDPEDNIISRAIRERRPFIVENAQEDPRVNPGIIRFLDVKSFIAVPLLSRSRVLGAVAADNLISQVEIKESKVQSLMIFVNQAALALENALMFEELKAFSAQLEDRVRRATGELRLAQRQLVQSEKLAALGKIAAGIAHEIRNPLTSIKILIHSLADDQATPADREKDLAVIEGEIGRMNGIIKQFLDFARPRPPSLEPVEIERLLDETLSLLKYEMEIQEIRCEKDYTIGLPPVPVDSEQMKQVFLNLMLNAIQAMKGGGTLRISTALKIALPGKAGEPWMEVTVSDTGKGIPKEIRSRIFEPFFSTKEEGVGLGLPIAERIVEEHGGEMGVESEPGKGTTFWIHLPLVKRPPGGPIPAGNFEPLHRRNP